MDKQTAVAVRAAEQAVTRLVEACRKGGPLYAQSPKAVAVQADESPKQS